MATNVEIKARVTDFDAFKKRIESISESPAELIMQEDVFFRTTRGRLKLRIFKPERGQLIYYERADRTGPKLSQYEISETLEPQKMRTVLEKALGLRGIVRKQRRLYWVGNTRIHLDEVESLGSFMELEVVLLQGQSKEEGETTAVELMAQLGIVEQDLIEGAYLDLLEGSQRST
jgi:predicted adenylyl cyclase CyaB